MKYLFILPVILFLASCATTERLAEGIAVKNVSGNGTFAKSAIGLNTETKIPEISTVFVSGDYSSAKSGTNSVTYREEISASTFNAKAVTRKRYLSITLVDSGSVPEAIHAVSDVLRASAEANKESSGGSSSD